jgi:dipeptidyl aminopeptidase/acylaminoacyl peptidase
VSEGSRQRALFVPNYLDEFTTAPTFRRGFTEQKVFVTKTDGSLERPFEIKLPKPEGAAYLRSVKWAADNQSLIVDRVDKDTKRRQLFYVHNVGGKDEQTITITEETDAKWIGGLSRIVEPHRKDNSQILFASEKNGFNHLYLASLEKGKPESNAASVGFSPAVNIKQLTDGAFEIEWAKWQKNGGQIIFSSTEKNTATREFYSYDLKTSAKRQIPATDEGMKTNPQFSSRGDENFLLYNFSRWNAPAELYAQRICVDCSGVNSPRKLTASIPERFKQTKWSEPQFFSFKAKDGKQIPAKIYLPNGFDKSKRYPMVIFVHGAGYLQNVMNGWNNYYREFMFHTILTQKGYVVLDIDYRGSAGYGRDFRTDVYDFLGGSDYEDHIDGIDYTVKNYAVDANKVGVYGGSYGGFMAEMLVMRAPKKNRGSGCSAPGRRLEKLFRLIARLHNRKIGISR